MRMVDALFACPNWSDLLGFAGVILLAIPAITMATGGMRAMGVAGIRFGHGVDDRIRTAFKDFAPVYIQRKLTEWTQLQTSCVMLGYACFVMSYLVKFFVTCSA